MIQNPIDRYRSGRLPACCGRRGNSLSSGRDPVHSVMLLPAGEKDTHFSQRRIVLRMDAPGDIIVHQPFPIVFQGPFLV